MAYSLRQHNDQDIDNIYRLLKDAVEQGAATTYSPAQIEAWATWPESTDQLRASLKAGYTVVAADAARLYGVGQLAPEDYIQLLYVAPDQLRRGIATVIFQHLEHAALRLGSRRLHTHASRQSKPLFEKQGFVLIERQWVNRHGVEIDRYAMQKNLDAAPSEA